MENQWLRLARWTRSWFSPLWRYERVGALIILASLLLLWWQTSAWFRAQLLARERVQVAEELSSYSNALTIVINRNFARLEGLKAFVAASPSQVNLDENFVLFAAGLYVGEAEIRNLIIAPGGVNRYVYPLQGNEAAVGHDLLNDPRPEVGEAARRAIETRRIVVTGPYELLQGGQGLVARQPIFRDGKFWGFVSIVLDISVLIDEAGLNARPASLEAALRDQTGRIFYGPEPAFDNDPVNYSVALPDGHWELAGLPSGGWDAAIRVPLLIFQVSGLIIIGLLFVMINVELTRRAALELAVQKRTTDLEHEAYERRQAEAALRESEARYHGLFEDSPLSLWEEDFSLVKQEFDQLRTAGVLDLEAYFDDHPEAVARCASLVKILEVNQATLSLLNARDKSELYAGLGAIFTDASLNVFRQELITLGNGGTRFDSENIQKTLTDDLRYVALSLAVAPGYEESWSKVFVSLIDITERKRAEIALQESEDRYRRLSDATEEAIAIHDQGIILDANQTLARMFGYELYEVIGMNVLEFAAPEWRDFLLQKIQEGYEKPYEGMAMKKDGTLFPAEVHGRAAPYHGRTVRVTAIRDLTERKRGEAALRASEERYRLLFDSNPLPMWVYDLETLAFLAVNDAAVHHYGYSRDEFLAMTIKDIRPLEDVPALLDNVARVTTGLDEAGVWRHRKKDGALIDVEVTSYALTFVGRPAELVLANDITERKRAEKALRESESRYRALFEFAPDGILIADPRSYYLDANASMCRMLGHTRDELIGLHASDIVAQPEIQNIEPALQAIRAHSDYHREWQFRRKDGSAFAGEASVTVMPDGNLLAVIRDITERKQAQAALQESDARFRSFMNNSATIAWMKDEHGRHVYLSETFEKRHGARLRDWQGRTDFEVWPHEVAEAFWRNDQEVLRSNQPMEIVEETKNAEGNPVYWLNFKFPFRDASGKRYIGGIGVDITERKEYERELEALATVSAASRSTQTRAEMLAVIMEQTMSLTHADGVTIVLIDPQEGDMVVEAVRGELSALAGSRLPQGQGIAGHVIATGQPYITNDLPNDPLIQFRQSPQLKSFVSVPLVTPNGIIGALQIAGRNRFADSLLSVLISVADMAAGAIQRVSLYERSLAHARELSQAYEETLAGWARALELRDEPTEGHTRRVTDLTLQLARKMKVSEDELEHIRRGCILHDIGKMGIPDSILRKPGRLTSRETMVMRRHPQYALEMLLSVPFLRPALDIPYCHHEKWDGTGYPRGLKGKQIPLAARIFAVVDVWDALTSDRPYRGPWSAKKASEYIRRQAGKHFDPRVVNIFLSMLAD